MVRARLDSLEIGPVSVTSPSTKIGRRVDLARCTKVLGAFQGSSCVSFSSGGLQALFFGAPLA